MMRLLLMLRSLGHGQEVVLAAERLGPDDADAHDADAAAEVAANDAAHAAAAADAAVVAMSDDDALAATDDADAAAACGQLGSSCPHSSPGCVSGRVDLTRLLWLLLMMLPLLLLHDQAHHRLSGDSMASACC